MSLTSRIQNYTNSVANENLQSALTKGIDYTISIVASANPSMLPAFAENKEVSVAGGGKQEDGIDWMGAEKGVHLLDVRIGTGFNTHCQPVPSSQAKDVENPKSIYYALSDNPVYWIDNTNELYIRPSPTSWAITFVRSSDGRTINDNAETIVNIPLPFIELVVLHAAECILMERLGDFRTKLPTDLDADTTLFDQIADVSASISYTFPTSEFSDAITKAQNLIDGTTMAGDTEPESVQYWLADEDEDMVQVTLATAAQELSRANSILSEFNAELGAQSTQKQQALAEFQANLAKKIQLYNTIIQKIQVDYQWTQGQLQVVNGKKQEFIQINLGNAGPKDNPSESNAV